MTTDRGAETTGSELEAEGWSVDEGSLRHLNGDLVLSGAWRTRLGEVHLPLSLFQRIVGS
jgi:hypothetical protein